MVRLTVTTLVLFLQLTVCSMGQDASPAVDLGKESVKPGINKAFLDPDLNVEEWVNRFEVESREILVAKDEILKQMKLTPGDSIADIGTGTGLFVEPFSTAVGKQGWVYALDIAPKFVERVEKLCEIHNLSNVTPVICGQDDIRLPPDSINVAFVCDVYHHFEYPKDSLSSIHKALRPGGRLIVVDFERIPDESRDWILGHIRAGKEVFKTEIKGAGFEFVEEVKISTFKENYFLVFEKK